MPSTFKIECQQCDHPGCLVLRRGPAVDAAQEHHEETGHAVTVRRWLGDVVQIVGDD